MGGIGVTSQAVQLGSNGSGEPFQSISVVRKKWINLKSGVVCFQGAPTYPRVWEEFPVNMTIS